MKKLISLFTSAIVFLGIIQISFTANAKNEPLNDGSVTILCSPDLTKLANDWVTEYMKLHPREQIRVLNCNDESPAKFNQSGERIGFFSNEYLNETNNRSGWEMVIGREVFVMIMNQENPFIEQIGEKGISKVQLSRFFESAEMQNWSTLLGIKQNIPVKFYISKNESAESAVSGFINKDLNENNLSYLDESAELISSVRKDKYAIGFCRLTDIISSENKSILQGIALVPIDKNNNGQIDSFEEIYSDLSTFSRGVWLGKYPHQFVSNIYLVSSERPTNGKEVAFLKWILTGGQKYLNSNGYNDLASSEKNSKLDKLLGDQLTTIQPEENYAGWKVAIMVIVLLIVFALIIETSLRYFKNRSKNYNLENPESKLVFNENSVESPGGLFFDKTHTWAFMENDGRVKIGIDGFLSRLTGQLTRVKMKKAGERINKNQVLLSIIQNGKQLSIKSPVSGTIVEENRSLKGNPTLINTSPYQEGWVYVIQPENWLREIQFLFMADKFKIWLKSEFIRLKDFIAFAQKSSETSYVPLILQEGGEIKEGVLMNFGPEIWEDFQADFIDKPM